MFKFILAACLVALAASQYGEEYGAPAYGHDLGQPIPYKYGYDIAGDHGEFKQSRQEHGDGQGNVQGSYSYNDAHGNQRVVKYVADTHGFRAQVQTNEPGTESQKPADVEFHSSAQKQQAYGPVGYGGPGPSYGGNGLY